MHDYLATDGESSIQPDETDNRRQLYYGQRDKNRVSWQGASQRKLLKY